MNGGEKQRARDPILSEDVSASATKRPSLYWSVLLLVAFVCAAFSAAASWVLTGLAALSPMGDESGLLLRSVAKGIAFSIAAVALLVLLRRTLRGRARPDAPPVEERERATSHRGLYAALVFAAVLVFPHLDRYPQAEPDEVHHLIVARNLAEFGAYASGHPDDTLVYFDEYDSVGPPVIAPIAGAFRLAGVSLTTARAVMAAFFLALCVIAFVFLRSILGTDEAVAGVFLLVTAWGSVYLARSAYGEVPALFFFILGLDLWRRGLRSNGPGTLLLSGTATGLAVLCKPFLLAGLWAFAAVWAFDRMSRRAIRPRHIAVPALALALVVAVWWIVKTVCGHDVTGSAHETLSAYRQNLQFGLRSSLATLGQLLRYPGATLAALIGLLCAAPILFEKRHDPPSTVLFLTAVLFGFWWVFFTDGHIPRYLWYTWAIGAAFAGRAFCVAMAGTSDRGQRQRRRRLSLLVVCVLVGPALFRTYEQGVRVFGYDELADEKDLAQFVSTLPRDEPIVTTWWPAARALNFFADRHVIVVKSLATPQGSGVVIVNALRQPDLLIGHVPNLVFGEYVVVSP